MACRSLPTSFHSTYTVIFYFLSPHLRSFLLFLISILWDWIISLNLEFLWLEGPRCPGYPVQCPSMESSHAGPRKIITNRVLSRVEPGQLLPLTPLRVQRHSPGCIRTAGIAEVPGVTAENPTLCQQGHGGFAEQAACRNDKIHREMLQMLSRPRREKPGSPSAQGSVPQALTAFPLVAASLSLRCHHHTARNFPDSYCWLP